ncbi:MAG: HK97 family phage prohead protease [Acidobacteriota bacterium]
MDRDARTASLLEPQKRFYALRNVRRDGDAVWAYGYATTEEVDSYDTVFALSATREAVKEYDRWRTLRGMHQPIAAGTVPVLELDDKGLWIGARVIDDAEIRKLEEGVYKGFSIGFEPRDGRWEMRGGRDVFVFTAYDLVEISLVDRNSNPGTPVLLWQRRAIYDLAPATADWLFDNVSDFEAIRAKGGAALLAEAYAWAAPDAGEDPARYALPVARLAAPDAERLTLNRYAVRAARAALDGGRDPLRIPEDERAAVRARLAALDSLFDQTTPGRRAQEDTMDETKITKAVETAVTGFFRRIFGGEPRAAAQNQNGQAAETPAKVRVQAAALEGAAGLRAAIEALGEAGAEVLGALDAVLGRIEAAPPTATVPPEIQVIQQRLQALEDENKALRSSLDQALSQRRSADTVQGEKPFKSRYGGAFAG